MLDIDFKVPNNLNQQQYLPSWIQTAQILAPSHWHLARIHFNWIMADP